MDKEAPEKEKKKAIISCYTFKLLWIPIFSTYTSVDEDEIYKRMEVRFEKAMTRSIEKAMNGKADA